VGTRQKSDAAQGSAEQLLEEATIRLLRRDGVLAGLNLRQVAEEAGVTRGLVYHHFGSRRALLRSALRNSARPKRAGILARGRLGPRARLADFLRRTIHDSTTVQLLTLLILDGDAGVSGLPYPEESRLVYERDIAEGRLSDDISVEGLQAGFAAAVYGWAIYRRSFANSLGVEVETLDAEVERLFHRMHGAP